MTESSHKKGALQTEVAFLFPWGQKCCALGTRKEKQDGMRSPLLAFDIISALYFRL